MVGGGKAAENFIVFAAKSFLLLETTSEFQTLLPRPLHSDMRSLLMKSLWRPFSKQNFSGTDDLGLLTYKEIINTLMKELIQDEIKVVQWC